MVAVGATRASLPHLPGVAMPLSTVRRRPARHARVPEKGQLPMAPAPTVPAILAPSMVALKSSVSGMGLVIEALKATVLPVSLPSKICVVLPSADSEPEISPRARQGERRLAVADRRAASPGSRCRPPPCPCPPVWEGLHSRNGEGSASRSAGWAARACLDRRSGAGARQPAISWRLPRCAAIRPSARAPRLCRPCRRA